MKEIKADEFKKEIFDFEAGHEKWVYEGDKPCIIDFYSTNCGPCMDLLPIMEAKSEVHEDVNFYKVNVDESPELATLMGVQSIPSVFFVGVDVDPVLSVGTIPDDQLEMFIGTIK